MIIYKILDNGYYGGEIVYPDSDGIPLGTTRTPPPDIIDGYYCKWTGRGWELTTIPPSSTQQVDPPIDGTYLRSLVEVVTMRQARRILFQYGYLNQINNYIQNLPQPDRDLAMIDWEYATEVKKTSSLVEQIAAELSLDKQTLDDLFYEASLIGD